jgi:hypothetical protein
MNFGPLAGPQRGSSRQEPQDQILQKLCALDHELMGRNDAWDAAIEQELDNHNTDNLTDLYRQDPEAVMTLIRQFAPTESKTPTQILQQRLNEAADHTFDRDSVNTIIAQLKEAGFHIAGNEGEFLHARVNSEKEILEPVPIEDEPMTYLVTPREGWVQYVEKTDDDWTEESESKGQQFETIMQDHNYELGSAGGSPSNFDYTSPDGNVTFIWHGNPYHI